MLTKLIPELRDLSPSAQRRAWRGGARYALNRWPFLLIALGLVIGLSILDVGLVEALVSSKLWRMCIWFVMMFVLLSAVNVLIAYFAKPYWRELRERDG